MCGGMVDIQSATADGLRLGEKIKKKIELRNRRAKCNGLPIFHTAAITTIETARRTSYFDSQNCEVEFLSHPLGNLDER